MSSSTWKALPNLSQAFPGAITTALNTMSGILDKANTVIKYIETILTTIENFLLAPGDILAVFLQSYLTAIIKVVQDTLSLGGALIVIHPFNRINKRKITTLFPTPWKIAIPVMTPQEAFNELYASFSNTNDPYRPQWTDNVEVTGFGLLVVAPDPTGFINIISAIQQLINLKELDDIIKGYTRSITAWAKDVDKQAHGQAKALAPFDITGYTELKFRSIVGQDSKGGLTFQTPLVFLENLPSLHWWGLSLSNFAILGQVTGLFEYLIKSLTNLIKTNNSAIKEMADAIIRKIQALQKVVQTVFDAIQVFLITLNEAGLYYFDVPKGVTIVICVWM